jgi:hypothetical protein
MLQLNVPTWERALRILVGIGMLWWGMALPGQWLPAWIVLASGAIAILTGLFGWCPVCAVAGRRLPG